MKFELERLTTKPFFISLGLLTIAYFAVVRLFQDWLYHRMKIDVRPVDMFESFGQYFSQAEPFEIILYLLGYIVVPVVAYAITPLVKKILSYRRSVHDTDSRKENKQDQTVIASRAERGVAISLDAQNEIARLDSSARQASPGLAMTKKWFWIATGIIGAVAVLFIFRKFSFSFYLDYIQTKGIWHTLWFISTKRIIVTYLMLGLGAIFFVGYYLYLPLKVRGTKGVMNQGNHNSPSLSYLKRGTSGVWETWLKRFWPILFILLAFLIFNPSIPIDPHHSNYFIGSVHEAYSGKALLFESSHLYGVFNIYLLLAVFKLIPLSFAMFGLVIMAVYVVYFSALWAFVRRWLNSYSLATLVTLVIVALTYFFQTGLSRSVLFLPAMSPFRWGLYVIPLFLLFGFERTGKSKYLHWSLFVAAFSLYWNFDSGLFLSAATLLTISYLKLSKVLDNSSSKILIRDSERENKQQPTVIASERERSVAISLSAQDEIASSQSFLAMTIKKFIGVVGEHLAYIVGIFVVTNVVNKIIYGSWPDWTLFFRESKHFATGIAMYPLPAVGVFEILFFVYAAVLVFAFVKLIKRESANLPLLFLTLYGVFSFIYYIGESSWQILYVVVPPFVLICAYSYRQWQEGNVRPGFSNIVRTMFATLVFFGLVLLAFKLPLEFSQRNYFGFHDRLVLIDPDDSETYADAQYLRKNYQDHRVFMMARNDTKLAMYSAKVNAFDFYYIFGIYFKSEMQKYADQILREKPEYVIVGKDQYRNDQVEYFLNGVKDLYTLKEMLKTVEIYERN